MGVFDPPQGPSLREQHRSARGAVVQPRSRLTVVINSTGRIVLEQLGADLGMTPAHIRGVIDSVLESALSRGNG